MNYYTFFASCIGFYFSPGINNHRVPEVTAVRSRTCAVAGDVRDLVFYCLLQGPSSVRTWIRKAAGYKQVRAGKSQFSCDLGKAEFIADLKADFQVLFFRKWLIELPLRNTYFRL